jgi:hypothetical protein
MLSQRVEVGSKCWLSAVGSGWNGRGRVEEKRVPIAMFWAEDAPVWIGDGPPGRGKFQRSPGGCTGAAGLIRLKAGQHGLRCALQTP